MQPPAPDRQVGNGRNTAAEWRATCSSAEPGRSVWRPSVEDREDGAAFQGHFQGKRPRRLPGRPPAPARARQRPTAPRANKEDSASADATRHGPGRQIRLSNHYTAPKQSRV